jgi:flagella basal body P-ring formation protein FlgA
MGSPGLELTAAEVAYRQKAGKVVVADRNLKSGETLQEKDIALKRVGSKALGTEIKRAIDAVGRKVRKDIKAHTAIAKEDLCEN